MEFILTLLSFLLGLLMSEIGGITFQVSGQSTTCSRKQLKKMGLTNHQIRTYCSRLRRGCSNTSTTTTTTDFPTQFTHGLDPLAIGFVESGSIIFNTIVEVFSFFRGLKSKILSDDSFSCYRNKNQYIHFKITIQSDLKVCAKIYVTAFSHILKEMECFRINAGQNSSIDCPKVLAFGLMCCETRGIYYRDPNSPLLKAVQCSNSNCGRISYRKVGDQNTYGGECNNHVCVAELIKNKLIEYATTTGVHTPQSLAELFKIPQRNSHGTGLNLSKLYIKLLGLLNLNYLQNPQEMNEYRFQFDISENVQFTTRAILTMKPSDENRSNYINFFHVISHRSQNTFIGIFCDHSVPSFINGGPKFGPTVLTFPLPTDPAGLKNSITQNMRNPRTIQFSKVISTMWK